MSYIRSTSNPESLYIWGDDKRVQVCHRVPKPLSSAKEMPAAFDIPAKTFDRVLARWVRSEEKVSLQGCSVEEVSVYIRELDAASTLLHCAGCGHDRDEDHKADCVLWPGKKRPAPRRKRT